jgi:hypothetical protein
MQNLPDDLRTALDHPDVFQIRRTVGAIPRSVQAAFSEAMGGERFSMAEPGAAWQSSDVVSTHALPWRRLESVAVSPSLLILCYERGGIAHSDNVAAFRLSDAGAKLIWRAVSDKAVSNPRDLLKGINEGTIHDYRGYGF